MKTLIIGSGVVVDSKCGKAPDKFRGVYRRGGMAGPCILRTRTGTVAGLTHDDGGDRNDALCIATSPYVRYSGLVVRSNVGHIICTRGCHLASNISLLGHTKIIMRCVGPSRRRTSRSWERGGEREGIDVLG